MAAQIQSPEKELRFTRSRQAVHFWIASAVFCAVGVTILSTSYYRDINPELPHPGWSLVALSFAAFMAHTAIHLTRHAYLILTPLGMEIFPFFRPSSGMRLILWQEVSGAEVNDRLTLLTLHHDAEKTSGIHLSLVPIPVDRRSLLAKAVIARVSPPPAANG